METRKIQNHGNSLAMNLPLPYCKTMNLAAGDIALIRLSVDKKMIITKFEPPPDDTKT